jgi:hypothetical protein
VAEVAHDELDEVARALTAERFRSSRLPEPQNLGPTAWNGGRQGAEDEYTNLVASSRRREFKVVNE